MGTVIDVGEVQSKVLEIIERAAHGEEFLVVKEGKPIARLVGLSSGKESEAGEESPGERLLRAVGFWGDLSNEEIDELVGAVYARRRERRTRGVTLE